MCRDKRFFFFFQAEDGIRYLIVTGVQTCALPILIGNELLDAGLGDADDDDFDLSEAFDSQLPDNRYLDRELSWLAFNQRVLELAEDPALPVLERANFLAIFASNLDEFF